MSDDESGFIDMILSDPDDPAPRAVYADWLEERGDVRAEFLRLEQRLAECDRRDSESEYGKLTSRLQQLHETIRADHQEWLDALSKSPIENCRPGFRVFLKFKFRCPKQWDHLQRTEEASVRFCEQCKKNVYYCRSMKEAMACALTQQCVALDPNVERSSDFLRISREQRGYVKMGLIGPR